MPKKPSDEGNDNDNGSASMIVHVAKSSEDSNGNMVQPSDGDSEAVTSSKGQETKVVSVDESKGMTTAAN
jgi:hypothetical protein